MIEFKHWKNPNCHFYLRGEARSEWAPAFGRLASKRVEEGIQPSTKDGMTKELVSNILPQVEDQLQLIL